MSVLAAVACRAPGKECDTQIDCFGGELCVDGACAVVVTFDLGGGRDTVSTGDGASHDASALADIGAADAAADGDAAGPDAACVPECGAAECGADPVCGTACGECLPTQECDEGACIAARVVTQWSLDGTIVNTTTSGEAIYTAAYDTMFVGLPHYGRNIQINIADASTANRLSYSCADEPITIGPLSLITSDNGWAELDALPDRWKSLILNGSHCLNPAEDTLSVWELEVTSVDPGHVVGTATIEITGGGPRAGETLRIESAFDLDATSM